MKKAQILRHLPNIKQLRKDAKSQQNLLTKTSEEVLKLEGILSDLQGVELHHEFPVQIITNDDGSIEVYAAPDETTRYAYLNNEAAPAESDERWRVTGYKSETATDGIPLAEGLSRKAALRAGKDFAATGKLQPRVRASKNQDAVALTGIKTQTPASAKPSRKKAITA